MQYLLLVGDLCWWIVNENKGDCVVLRSIRVSFAINQLHNVLMTFALSPQQRQLLVTN